MLSFVLALSLVPEPIEGNSEIYVYILKSYSCNHGSLSGVKPHRRAPNPIT